jgi:hypothetical protein
MSGLDLYLNAYKTIQNNGAPLPQRGTVNVLAGILTVADDPINKVTTLSVAYPLVNPTVQGSSGYAPTPAQAASFGIVGGGVQQAFWGGSGSVTVGFFPMPGQPGAPVAAGGIHVDVLHKMSGFSAGSSSGSGATFKSSASWHVSSAGVVTAEQATASQPVAIGTNGNAPPGGWASSLQLNAGSTSVEVVVTGAPSHSLILAQALYAQ